MIQIGITGGIGSGKSTVCQFFALLGIPVYDADSEAKKLMTLDRVLVGEIKASFGEASYLPDGSLNRRYLAEQVFGQGDKVRLLNSLVHPAVRRHAALWAAGREGRAPYILREAALMFESGSYLDLHKTILVSAPENIRLGRVMRRDPDRSEAEVRAIFAKQMPEEEKAKLADFTIINDGLSPIIPQALKLHDMFLSMRKP